MNISIRKLIPTPLADSINPKSDIWNSSVTFSKGNYYLIDAQSGKGKSTFIQSLYGIRRDYNGEIIINDDILADLDKTSLAKLRQNRLSVVFQDLRLFPELTALENITINANLSKNRYTDDIPFLFDRLNIGSLKHKQTSLLSYGEKQRVAIIRALTQNFDWILLDEPYAHLDKENTLLAHNLILEITQELDAGIILTSLGEDSFISFENTLTL